MKIALLLALSLAGTSLGDDLRVTSLLQQGDAADARHESASALVFFAQAETLEPRNLGVLLRISKEYTDLAGQAKSPVEARAFADKALEYGTRSVALDEHNAKAHLNLAICYGKLTEYAGNRLKVEYAKLIREEVQRSLDLDGTDDYAWHVLGRWNAQVANLGTVLRTIANYVYGGLPPASNEEAVRCFKKATELAPQRVMHHAELAKAYGRISKPDLAAQEWQNVVGLRSDGTQDEQYQRDARLALEQFRQQGARGGRGVARR